MPRRRRPSLVEQVENDAQGNQTDKAVLPEGTEQGGEVGDNLAAKERNRRAKQDLNRNSKSDQQQRDSAGGHGLQNRTTGGPCRSE